MASKPKKTEGIAPAIDAAATPEVTGNKVASTTQFKAGAEWRGNAAGRPRGSRNKIAEDFLADVHEAWQEHGKAAVKSMATEEPSKFVQVVAGLLPKELNITNTVNVEQMSDDELFEQLDTIKSLIASATASAGGGGQKGSGRDPSKDRAKEPRGQLN